jgi:hypothetical protein
MQGVQQVLRSEQKNMEDVQRVRETILKGGVRLHGLPGGLHQPPHGSPEIRWGDCHGEDTTEGDRAQVPSSGHCEDDRGLLFRAI